VKPESSILPFPSKTPPDQRCSSSCPRACGVSF